MPKVVIPDDWPPVLAGSSAFQMLHEIAEVQHFDTLPNSEERLMDRVRDADIVITIRSSSRFTAELFQTCPRVRLVSIWGTGTDNVDLIAAQRHGVTITNTPGVSAISIAEHALALLLAVARRLPQMDAATRGGQWPRGQSVELYGKTCGIIGLGAIGRQFARLAGGIGMRVIAWTMHPKPMPGVALVALEELYRASDVVSLHLRLSAETVDFIGSRQFALMKNRAILINTARGAIVNEAALLEALAEGRISGAGLEV